MAEVHLHEYERRAAGFTLLELLIAISILAILVAMMAGSLSFSATVWDKSDAVAERSEMLIVAQRLLRRQLGEAQPLNYSESRRVSRLAFDGKRAEIKFVTGSLSHATVGGPYLVIVGLSGRGKDKRLVFSWRELAPDLSDFDDQKRLETADLIDGVTNVEISYFGQVPRGENRTWQSSWENKKVLPMLVRIRLGFDRTDDRSWPEFVASTRVRPSSLR